MNPMFRKSLFYLFESITREVKGFDMGCRKLDRKADKLWVRSRLHGWKRVFCCALYCKLTSSNRLSRWAHFQTGIIKLHVLQMMLVMGLSGRQMDMRCRQIHNKDRFFACSNNSSTGSLQITPLRRLADPTVLELCSQNNKTIKVNLCTCNGRWYRFGNSFILHCATTLLLSHDCKPKACFLMWSCH